MIICTYKPENNLIITVFHGEVTPKELHDLIEELISIDCETGNMRGLVFLSKGAKTSGIKYGDIYSAGKRMSEANFRKNGKNAIVASSPLAYGLSRIYKVATEIKNLDETNVYKEGKLPQAIEWLGISHLSDQIHEMILQYQ